MVVEIQLNEKVLYKTTVMRRSCANCKRGYNLADINEAGIVMPPLAPRIPGKCDGCGGLLVQRADDREDVVRDRLRVYDHVTKPLLAYYGGQGKLVSFDVKKGKHDWPRLREHLEAYLEKTKDARETAKQEHGEKLKSKL